MAGVEKPHKIDFKGALLNELAHRFAEEAEKRGISPAALAADILETVIRDDLFAAVLDP